MSVISDGKLFLTFGDPKNSPELTVTQNNQLDLKKADLTLEANRKVLFGGNGQISAVGDLSFLTAGTPTVPALTIFANGNVGIGTGTRQPTDKLEIAGSLKLETGLSVNQFSGDITESDQVVPTARAVKTYVDSKASPELPDGSVTDRKIANNAVTTDKIADDSITAAKIKKGAIAREKLDPSISFEPADGAVTTPKIADNSVTTIKIQNGAITQEKLDPSISVKIPDGSVDTAQLANSAITSDKIADKSITAAKLNFSISAGGSQWSDLTDHSISYSKGNVGIGTGTSIPQAKLQIANGAIMPSAGNSETAGIMFPKDAFGGRGDAAWIRHYARTGEATTLEIGTSNDPDDHIALMPSGNVGIGTTNPIKGKVHIEGSVRNDVSPFAYYAILEQKTNLEVKIDSDPQQYSLYANQRIAATEFNAFSDVRIKEIQGRSDSQNDLQSLLQIEVTDYYYRDKIVNGDRQQKKVIGQQVATVFPQAVKTHTDVVPDIFKPASIADGWVSLRAHGLQVGERVRLLLEGVEPQIYTIEAVTPDSFQVSLYSEGEVFVYGREVNDFHVVDYDALAMLNISATQELYKIIDALKIEVQQLKAQLNGSHHPIAAFSSP